MGRWTQASGWDAIEAAGATMHGRNLIVGIDEHGSADGRQGNSRARRRSGMDGPQAGAESLPDLLAAGFGAPADPSDEGAIAHLSYTSGTTGRPKGACLMPRAHDARDPMHCRAAAYLGR